MKTPAEKYSQMTTTPIPKLVTVLAIPTILSMLVTALYNMADTYFIGRIKGTPEEVTSATGAAAVVFSLMFVIQACGFFFGQGSGNYISRELGNKNREGAEKMATFGFVSAIIFGGLIAVFGLIFIDPLTSALSPTSTIFPYAKDYAKFILIGAPLMCGSFVLNNQMRFQGNAAISMIGIISGAVINVGLDALFILGFGMGTDGAGLATAIGQGCGFIVLYIGMRLGNNVKIKMFSYRFKWKYMKEVIDGGTPSLARQGLSSVATMCLNYAARGWGGDPTIAAMGIVSRIMSFCFSAILGFGQGFQPVCGFNYGAKLYGRVKAALFFCLKVSYVILAAVIGSMFAFAPFVVKLFRDDPEVISVGALALRAQCAAFICVPFITYVNMMLQTIGKVIPATVLSMGRQGIFFIPTVFLLPLLIGLYGIIAAQPLADVLTFVLALIFGVKEIKLLGAMQKEVDLKQQKEPENVC
ncbi:MAG: MATE family efflux transporter [Clostridia bacterium]|nr:MATE family efflux transporter [Clostridia bacterium]